MNNTRLSKRTFLRICKNQLDYCDNIRDCKSINKKEFNANKELIKVIVEDILNVDYGKDYKSINYVTNIFKRMYCKFSFFKLLIWIFFIMLFAVSFADAFFRVGDGEYNKYTIVLDNITTSFAVILLCVYLFIYLCAKYGWFVVTSENEKIDRLRKYIYFLIKIINDVSEIPDKEFNKKLKKIV